MPLTIQPPDFAAQDDRRGIIDLLLSYAGGPQAGGKVMTDHAQERVVQMLADNPAALVLLAKQDAQTVGMAVCVESFSTFRAAPVLNVHDLVVAPDHQNRGIGSRLLEAVEQLARDRGACSITLEVIGDNEPAKRLYKRMGFLGGVAASPPNAELFYRKPLY